MIDFEKVYREHFNDVFLFIKSLSHDEQIAEEITSETFFKALNALDSFKGNCDIRVWLCQIAKNCYFSYLQRSKRTLPIEDIENQPNTADLDVEEFVANSEASTKIHQFLHDLDEPYKEVFTLRIFAELSFKKIGELFGKTDNWACVTFHRAKGKLRKKMEGLK